MNSTRPGNIPIAAAKELSKKYNCPMLVIYAIHEDRQNFTVTTYGETKKMCRHMADMGQKLSKAILNGEVVPSETEPMHIPDEPMIYEGTSNGDV